MKFKTSFLIALLLASITNVIGQINTGQLPKSFKFSSKIEKPKPINFSVSPNEILAKKTSKSDSTLFVAIPVLVNKNLMENSTKVYSDDNFNIYQMVFISKDATSLGTYFSEFYLPNWYELYAFNYDKTDVIGAFTYKNNSKTNKFAISPISGENLVLELYEPKNLIDIDNPRIIISQLSHHFRQNSQSLKSKKLRPNSTQIDGLNCYLDVMCESNFEKERAVFLWEYQDIDDNNFYVCSGSMINQDVPNSDLRPFAYTAEHCGGSADLTTAIFNFHFQNSICNVTSSPPNYSLVGATFRSKKSLSDMFLMELDNVPPPEFNIYYLGWDRNDRNDLPDEIRGIHHAEGGKKAVSVGTFNANTNPYFWRVTWDINNHPTSQGSSGSPLLLNNSLKVIGDLSYGTAQCDNLDGIDRYGKFRAQGMTQEVLIKD